MHIARILASFGRGGRRGRLGGTIGEAGDLELARISRDAEVLELGRTSKDHGDLWLDRNSSDEVELARASIILIVLVGMDGIHLHTVKFH